MRALTRTRRIAAIVAATALLTSGFLNASISPASAASATAADSVMGQGGSYTASGFATTATGLKSPKGAVADGIRHRLFVVDGNNNRVLVYNLNTDNTLPDDTADFVIGQSNFTSAAATCSAANFNGPSAIALDPSASRIYVADPGCNRVLVFDAGNIANGMSATVALGQTSLSAGLAATTQAGLATPTGVTMGPDNRYVYIADRANHRVLVFDSNMLATGMNATYVLGQSSFTTATPGTTSTAMDRPYGVAIDATNSRLFVVEYNNNRVDVFDLTSLANGMSATYVIGKASFTGASSINTNFVNPTSVAVGNGKIFVADQGANRILAYSSTISASDPAPIAVFGQPDYVTTSASAVATTSMSNPNGVYFDPFTYKLYIEDSSYNRVLIFDTTKNGFQLTGTIDPIFTFSVLGRSTTCNGQSATGFKTTSSATLVSLGSLSTTAVTSAAQDLAVSTNAANGFSVFVKTTGASSNPFSDGNGHSVADVAGTAAAPGVAPVAGTPGFGFTSSDTATPFTSNTFAKLSTTNGLASFGAAGITSKNNCVGFSAAISSTSTAGSYSAPVVYTAVPSF